MAERLHERFAVGDSVEIYFSKLGTWVAGQVVDFDAPGVWVRDVDGRRWFVTNGRRIRPRSRDVNSPNQDLPNPSS